MNEVSAITRPKAGRPTREQAEQRHNELLETALDHFLEKGFELGTIEAIALRVGMTKRTVYARYPDKVSLFRAAVNLALDRYAVSQEELEATDRGDIAQTLSQLARLRVDMVATPNGLRLQRIINTESYRFPDLFAQAYERGALPAIRFMAAILERETKAGRLAIDKPMKASIVFMSMVAGGPARIIIAGMPLSDDEIDQRIAYAVRLFLNGALPR